MSSVGLSRATARATQLTSPVSQGMQPGPLSKLRTYQPILGVLMVLFQLGEGLFIGPLIGKGWTGTLRVSGRGLGGCSSLSHCDKREV